MISARVISILVVLMSPRASGQSTARPAFEVASIKPAPPQASGRVSTRMSENRGRLNYTNVSLRDVIGQAYHLQHGQISGPPWIDTERFDIAAKIPAGAAMDQIPQMLQSLLADRFKLRSHSETKEQPVYALVAGKNGPKFQKAESSSGPRGGSGRGRAHVSGKFSMPRFADYLSDRLGRPVLDQTKLDGAYAITLDWVPDSSEESASGPSIFTALQEQLGLKLVATKGPTTILVIDHVEKAPTEN